VTRAGNPPASVTTDSNPSSPLGNPKVALAVWIVAALVLASSLGRVSRRANQLDFSHYYASALAMSHGGDPYRADLRAIAAPLGLNLGENTHATYPPTFLLMFEPLTLMSPARAYWIWTLLDVIAAAGSLMMLLGTAAGFDRITAISLAGFAVLYPAVGDNFYFGQSQMLVLFLLTLTMRLLERGRERAAGCALAVAGLLRIFPLIMLGFLLVRSRWRAFGYMIAGVVAGLAITAAFAGIEAVAGFSAAIPFVTNSNWLIRPANVALGSFIARIFIYCGGLPLGPGVEVALRLVAASAEATLLCATALATSARAGDHEFDARAFCLWVVATVLLAPTAWLHYLVLMFIPFAAILSAWMRGGASARTVWTAVASYMTLVMMLLFVELHAAGNFRAIASEAPFVSLAMCYVATWWFVRDTA
jgi:glycosyl transferase family 87